MISKPNLCKMKQGWEIKKLGEVCEKLTDGSHNPPKGILHSDYLMLSSQNIHNDKILFDDVRFLSKDDFIKEDKRTLVREGDILITIVGTIGRCAVFTGNKTITLQRSVAVLRPQNNISSRYLMYCIIGENSTLNEESHGIAQKGIYLKQLSQIPIPIPPLAEQERIVAELDCLSGVIEKKKQQLKELDALAQSIFYEMFGDPITNEKGWEVKKFGDEFEISSGGTPDTKNKTYWDGGNIPWIGSNMCHNKVIYKNDGKFITKAGFDSSSTKMYHSGYVIVALVGATIGKTALLKFSTTTNQNISGINVPLNNNYTSEYIFYLIQNLYGLFQSIGNGKFKMASLTFIRSLPLLVPPLSFQQAFASKIEAIEKQKELIKQSIKEVETLFNSRMDYYFN